VDLNRNSVQICKLRLWIELLKSSYYTEGSLYAELETLPNIDVNIKRGNSLVARYALDMDLAAPLRKKGWNVAHWMNAVRAYQNAGTKHEKREAEKVMAEMREALAGAAYDAMPDRLKLTPLKGELTHLQAPDLIARDAKDAKSEARIEKLRSQVAAIEERLLSDDANPIFREAFEWRYEFPEVLDEDGSFVGFDAVIGNPPYIRQEELGKYKEYFARSFNTYHGTADLFVYFIERGMNLLCGGGCFGFIVANKWMRANYGITLRAWIKKTKIEEILDFGDLPVFESATTYPCILRLVKEASQKSFNAANVESLDFADLGKYVARIRFEVALADLEDAGWNLVDERGAALLKRLMGTGTPLNVYVGNKLFYGIKTGLNEAFVIDEETRFKLISEDPKSTELIKPFLGGRDVRRYEPPAKGKYLILIPKGWTDQKYPSRKGKWDWFQSEYPAIAGFIAPFEVAAKKRTDQGDYWWELRACDYYEEFQKPKIVVPAIVDRASFAIDKDGYYSNDKTTIISIQSLFLLGILNSSISNYILKKIASTKQGGYFEQKPMYIEKLPIPPTPSPDLISPLVEQILDTKKADPAADVTALEAEIDSLVYSLYGLTEEEITVVEGRT
jgi:adenine-specific DNA-methyltransferase